MIEVRKARKGELEKIIDTANKSFIPVRYPGFDFKERMPKIYAKNEDLSDIHFVVEEDNKFKAVAGNLINKLTLNDKEYPYSIVGTVSTLPSESNKGYMALLMKEIEKENIEKEVVFSMLTGKRQRYVTYGYERSGSRIVYTLNNHYFKFHNVEEEIEVREHTKEDVPSLYEIYKNNQPIILRNEEDFIIDLRISNSTIYTLLKNNKIIGYFALGDALKVIHELSLVDNDDISRVSKAILKYLNKDSIDVLVNPLNIKLMKALELISEEKIVIEEIMFKVYKMIPFIEMCLELNKDIKNFISCSEVYKVEDQIIKISVEGHSYKVEETKEEYLKEFTNREFVDYMLSITNYYHNESKIFPLALDFNEGDMF